MLKASHPQQLRSNSARPKRRDYLRQIARRYGLVAVPASGT
jgi:hypothetical protein